MIKSVVRLEVLDRKSGAVIDDTSDPVQVEFALTTVREVVNWCDEEDPDFGFPHVNSEQEFETETCIYPEISFRMHAKEQLEFACSFSQGWWTLRIEGRRRVGRLTQTDYSAIVSLLTLLRGSLSVHKDCLPNKSLQPTPTAVMPPAAQEIMPAVGVAEH
jgi:hypothetical protein